MNRPVPGRVGIEPPELWWRVDRLGPRRGAGYPSAHDNPAAEGGDEPLVEVLRPLRKLLPMQPPWELDEQATAEQVAGGVCLPVLKRSRRLRWDVIVIVDAYPSMAVWDGLVRRFISLLRRHAAVHDVRVCRLVTLTADPDQVRLRGPDSAAVGRAFTGLPPVRRRRMVLVLSDGAGPAWQAGAVEPHLHAWACRQPVAIVHLLPQQMWYRSGITPLRLRLRAPSSGAANRRMRWKHHASLAAVLDTDDLAGAVPLPVVELRPRWLSAWVELIAGRHPRWNDLPAVLTTPRRPPAAAAQPTVRVITADGAQRVREFTSWASPTALELATHLAAAPLDWPVIRVVQRELLPTSEPVHLAEVLTSSLVRATGDSGVDQPAFEFAEGVREELLAAGRRSDTLRVWRTLRSRLGPARPDLAGWGRVIEDPDAPLPPVTPATTGMAQLQQGVLQALSGAHLPRARQLRSLLNQMSESGTPAVVHRDAMMTVGEDADADGSVGKGAGLTSSTPAHATASARTPAVWGNLPPRNPNFTGRDALLEDLHRQIREGATAVVPHALYGMGGVGKSHLAIEYVYRHQGEYDLIWWIPAERSTQIGASLVELARRMGLSAGSDIASARAAVKDALRTGRPYARWLLIFDNAENADALIDYLPTGGSGDIMITSRSPRWGTVARTVEVDVFTRHESIALLRRRGPELSDRDANQLADKLGDLPLALEQAAAWRAETGMSADEYLQLFDRQRMNLLDQARPEDYPLPVAAAWNVSLDRLETSNPAAFRLLQVCSFLAPEPIPRTLFSGAQNRDIHPDLNDALGDPIRLNRAIRDINRYALARIIHRTNSIQMHRLVQAVLIDRMTEPERTALRRSAHLLLAAGDRNDPDSPGNWASYADLHPHVVVSEAVTSTQPWVQNLVQNEAKYLYWWGDFKESLELSERAYETWRTEVGEEAPATLAIGHWLGFMLYRLGQHTRAAEQNSRILAAYERMTDEDHEDKLRAIGAVAADKRAAGDFQQALEMDEDLHERHVRTLGPDDPNTLNAAHNLAVSLRLVGDVRRAFTVDEQTYHRRVELFGEDHTLTLESHLNLIIDRRELGDYLPARAEMQNMVDRLPQAWGTAQTQVLLARRRLASAIRKAGDHAAALALSTEVHEEFSNRFGRYHPDTLLAAFGLAVDRRATRDLDGAARLSEEITEQYARLFAEDHPYTVASRLNTAIIYRLQRDLDRARRINEAGVEVLTRRLGASHPMTLAGRINFGNDLYELGEYSVAYESDRETAERCGEVFGDEHPTTLICLGNLAQDLVALDRQQEGYDLHRTIVPKFNARLGERHPATEAGTDLTVRGNCDLDPMPL
ncbi:FxSxx-COOH system tetratricopeptide repeat protein [Micromonospora ureilytica]|uniref:FxSxx-COOH system tetratricopeptide repeat protein n=1 Tax=Micromonospora ureilytica TaxID=709868 RepID=UPI003409229F